MPPRDLSSQFPTFSRLHGWLVEEGNVSRKHLWSAALGIALILIVAGVFLTLAWQNRGVEASRQAALQTVRLTQTLDAEISEVENLHRRAFESRDRRDFDRFERHRREVQRLFSELILPLNAQPEQKDEVMRLHGQFQRWVQDAAPEASGPRPNFAPPGPPVLDELRASLSSLTRRNDELFNELDRQAQLQKHFQLAGLGLLGLLGVTFLIVSSASSYKIFKAHLRKAESALAQTHSIIATTQDGVIVINDQGSIQSINPAAEKMFAQSAASVLGRNISLLIPQRLFFHDMASVGRGSLMAVGQRQGYYPFPIEISLSEMKVDGRRHFCALIRDVTERKRGEETLKHIGLGVSAATGEQFVRSLLQQLSKALPHDRAFLLEVSGRPEAPTALLTTAQKGELRTTASLDLTNTACAEVLSKGFRAFLDRARSQFPEDSMLEEFGAEAFVGMPLADHNGRSVGVMGILDRQPIAETQVIESTLQIFAARAAAEIERKRSEEALAAEKERLAVTLRSIGDGCLTLDNDGRVRTLNPVAERLTGWSQEAAVGKPLGEVLHLLDERTRRPCQHALQRMMQFGTTEGLGNATILVARDNSERLIESSSAPIRDRNSQKMGVIIVLRDITERQRIDEERQKAEKLESLGVVAGGIAHDFNNILTAILGNISLALNSKPGGSVSERLEAAQKATHRAQELAGQLLTFAKGGAPIKQTANLGQLLEDTLVVSLAGTTTHPVFHLSDDLWPIEADPGQLAQVISNIASNADQAMPAGGTLRVTAENVELMADSLTLGLRAGRWVRFTFHDEGIGIPEHYLKKVFDPYFTTKPKGSGLGLATAYSVVKNHGGIISAESKPGTGTTIIVCLPASDKQLAPASAPVAEPVPVGSGRVLVLDDEEAICMLVTCALEPLGYEVTETQDALTAIAKYDEALKEGRKYDLVISDLTIPGGMGGQEAIQRLLELDPDVRAIVSSGYANDPVMSRYEEFGFSGMIAKPYEIDALGRKVAEIMAQTPRQRVIFHSFDRKSA